MNLHRIAYLIALGLQFGSAQVQAQEPSIRSYIRLAQAVDTSNYVLQSVTQFSMFLNAQQNLILNPNFPNAQRAQQVKTLLETYVPIGWKISLPVIDDSQRNIYVTITPLGGQPYTIGVRF